MMKITRNVVLHLYRTDREMKDALVGYITTGRVKDGIEVWYNNTSFVCYDKKSGKRVDFYDYITRMDSDVELPASWAPGVLIGNYCGDLDIYASLEEYEAIERQETEKALDKMIEGIMLAMTPGKTIP